MPTGYTYELEEKLDFDVKKWLESVVPRAFGMFISLRDETAGYIAPDELLKRIEVNDSYEQKNLKESKLELKKALKLSADKWKTLFVVDKEIATNEYDRRKSEMLVKKAKMDECYSQIKTLWEKDSSETNHNIVNFAKEQLELVSGEYRVFDIDDIFHKSWVEYKHEKISKLERDVKYYAEEVVKEKERCESRVGAYKEWLKFLEENL